MTLRLLRLALLVAVGCAAPEPGSLRVDPERALLPAARKAAARVYSATGISVQVGEGADLRVRAYLASDEDTRPSNWRECGESCRWAGVFSLEHKRIRINRDAVPERRWETIVLHEMIHALTLEGDHLEPGIAGVMVGESDAGECLTEADVALICDRIECAWFQPEACSNSAASL